MSFTCSCIYCGESFEAQRSTAKFCKDSHRSAYAKKKEEKKLAQIPKLSEKIGDPGKLEEKIGPVPGEADEELARQHNFVPNWKEHGFRSKEEGVIKAIKGIAGLGFPNTLIMWKGEAFLLNPSKDLLPFEKRKKHGKI